MLQTSWTSLLGIEAPIAQAPIGSATNPALAAAVSNAGGLGSLAMSWREPEVVRSMIEETRALTDRPFAVNLVLEWDQRERLRIALDAGTPVVSFSWGDPTDYARIAHEAGAVVGCSAGSVREAVEALGAGADFIVAQGWEAGGHVRGDVSTMVLVRQIRKELPDAPLLAAGGIADGHGLAAALALGADGVWMGTRFLLSGEAQIHDQYRQALLRSTPEDTVKTNLFDIGWDAPQRVLRNSTYSVWESAGGREPRPNEGETVAHYGDGTPIPRYSFALPRPDVKGDIEAMAMYGGQSVGLLEDIRPAAELVREIVDEARQALARLGAQT